MMVIDKSILPFLWFTNGFSWLVGFGIIMNSKVNFMPGLNFIVWFEAMSIFLRGGALSHWSILNDLLMTFMVSWFWLKSK